MTRQPYRPKPCIKCPRYESERGGKPPSELLLDIASILLLDVASNSASPRGPKTSILSWIDPGVECLRRAGGCSRTSALCLLFLRHDKYGTSKSKCTIPSPVRMSSANTRFRACTGTFEVCYKRKNPCKDIALAIYTGEGFNVLCRVGCVSGILRFQTRHVPLP
jgi:hypothetical protein